MKYRYNPRLRMRKENMEKEMYLIEVVNKGGEVYELKYTLDELILLNKEKGNV